MCYCNTINKATFCTNCPPFQIIGEKETENEKYFKQLRKAVRIENERAEFEQNFPVGSPYVWDAEALMYVYRALHARPKHRKLSHECKCLQQCEFEIWLKARGIDP